MSGLAQTLPLLVAQYGFIVLFLIVFIEEAGVPLPLPSDILLLVCGSFVARGELSFATMIGAALAGTVLGSALLYTLARHGGRPLVRRYGHWIRLNEQRLDRAAVWLTAHPIRRLFGFRLFPRFPIYSTIAAGILVLPRAYATAAFAGSGMLWALVWTLLGAALHAQITGVIAVVSRVDRIGSIVAITIAAMIVAALVVRTLRSQRSGRASTAVTPQAPSGKGNISTLHGPDGA